MRSRNVDMEALEEINPEASASSTEVYTFTHKLPSHSSILYCFAAQTIPQLPVDSSRALSLLESTSFASRFPPDVFDRHKLPEEAKVLTERRFTREAVKAAVKLTLKCKSDSGYERQQGFAENLRSLAMDMGILNTIKYILPKIPIILVSLAS